MRAALRCLDAQAVRAGRWLAGTRLARWATAPLNLLAPAVKSQILIIVQADGNVSVAYDHPKCADDVIQLVQGIGTSLQIVSQRHNIPLAVQQADGTKIPLTNLGLPAGSPS